MATNQRYVARTLRQARVRKKVRGTDACPRVCVFRSNKHIYAQVISDERGIVLAAVSTLSGDPTKNASKSKGIDAAKQVGLALAKICKEKSIDRLVFDRNGFLFHGRVKALADGIREGGIHY
jgi:large subunit ribosomal protein L18